MIDFTFDYTKDGLTNAVDVRERFVSEYPALKWNIIIAPSNDKDAYAYVSYTVFSSLGDRDMKFNGRYISQLADKYSESITKIAIWFISVPPRSGVVFIQPLSSYIEKNNLRFGG